MDAIDPINFHDGSVKAIAVSALDRDLLNACVRLVRLLESPEQYRMIAPLVIREIVCRLLSGEQAHRMRHLATVGGHAHRMVRAVNKLREEFAKPLSTSGILVILHAGECAGDHPAQIPNPNKGIELGSRSLLVQRTVAEHCCYIPYCKY